MPRVAVAECVMTSQCIVCLAINSSLRMQVRKGAGAEVVYGVVWCGVGVCLRLLVRAKFDKKRDNAVDDLPITRKLYAVQFAKAVQPTGRRRCDDALTHTRRAQLLLHIVKQLLLYIPEINIIREAPNKSFATGAAVDTSIALIIDRKEILIDHSSQRSRGGIVFGAFQ